MELSQYFKSIIDQDKCSVVICNLQHEIIYMNPSAVTGYSKRGGDALIGKNLFNCHNEQSRELIKKIIAWFEESVEHNIIHTFYDEKENKDGYMVALRSDAGKLIGYYEKHEYRNRETDAFYNFKG